MEVITPIEAPAKRCSRCKDTFPVTDEFFYRLKNSRDGLQHYCKTCTSEYVKEHHKKNPISKPATPIYTLKQMAAETGFSEKSLLRDVRLNRFFGEKINGVWHVDRGTADIYVAARNAGTLPIIGQPLGNTSQCGACGNQRGNIVGDIDTISRQQYGYLCARCSRLVQSIQSDVVRTEQVISYLKKTRKASSVPQTH